MDEKCRYEGNESKTTIGMIYGQNPKYHSNGCLGAKSRIGMCQTVRVMSTRKLYVYDSWNGVPLTDNAEGEEMTLTLYESIRIVNH